MKPLNPKYKLRLGKKSGSNIGHRFQIVELVDKKSDKVLRKITIKTRHGIKGSEETRAKIIKEFALKGLRDNQTFIDSTEYQDNPMKTTQGRTLKQQRATKKLIAFNKKRRAVKRRVVKRRPTVKKRNPTVKKRAVKTSNYGYLIGLRNADTGKTGWFTGTGFDTDKKKAIISRSKQVMLNVAQNIPAGYIKKGWNLFIDKESCSTLGK